MGMGFEQPAADMNHALFTQTTTEQNQRIFYQRWAEFMEARDWSALHPGASANFANIMARRQP